MTLLIIGGTEFLGRYLVYASLARGHRITLFNRGRTNPRLFPEVEKLRGDRGGDLHALAGRKWDAVIDTCGYLSSKVRATASLLLNSIEHYTFVSSISVYRDFSRAGMDESGPLETLPENTVEDESNDDSYGARKVLCENAAEAAMPGRVLKVRAGLIVGPHAGIDRFPYWVRRVARGGHVLTFGDMLEACKAATESDAWFTWVDEDFLAEQGVKPFSELPFWLPGKQFQGFFALNCDRAFALGLTCRDLVQTARDTLEWDRQRNISSEPPKRPTVLAEGRIGLDPERERQLLNAWSERERSPRGMHG